MTHEEAFLQAIREAPDDDAPRLLYADWLEERGDPRGEFIRVQCARACLPARDPRDRPLRGRAWELLEANWDAWVRPLRDLVGLNYSRRGESWLGGGRVEAIREAADRFPRGFVSDLTIDADAFLAGAGLSSPLLALRSVRLWAAGARPYVLAESPHLAHVESLSAIDIFSDPFNDKCARALAASPHVARLRELYLRMNNVSDAGAEALARAPWLGRLRLLDLARNGLSVAGAAALASSPYLMPACVVHLGNDQFDRDTLDWLADAHGRPRNQFRY